MVIVSNSAGSPDDIDYKEVNIASVDMRAADQQPNIYPAPINSHQAKALEKNFQVSVLRHTEKVLSSPSISLNYQPNISSFPQLLRNQWDSILFNRISNTSRVTMLLLISLVSLALLRSQLWLWAIDS